MHARYMLLAWTLFSAACKTANPGSQVAGHFTEGDMASLNAHAGKQTIVPEYAPAMSVIVMASTLVGMKGDVHKEMTEMAQTIVSAGSRLWLVSDEELNGNSLGIFGFDAEHRQQVDVFYAPIDGPTSWVRDFGPLSALTNTQPRKLIFASNNYESDAYNNERITQAIGEKAGVERLGLPLYLAGGNVLCNDRECFATRETLEEEKNGGNAGDEPYGESDLKAIFAKAFGKPLTMVDQMPSEGTGHIDMWAKFLKSDQLVVASINRQMAATVYQGKTPTTVTAMADYLDKQASFFLHRGYTVMRMPMPIPYLRNESAIFWTVRSYTNSLFVNGTAIVPRYAKPYISDDTESPDNYPDQSLLAGNEAEVEKIYTTAGYKVAWIRSDRLIFKGGAVHCATMQVPRAD